MYRRSTQLLLLSVAATAACHEAHSEKHEPGTFQVTKPLRKDTELIREYVAQVRAIQHIEMRALEGGYLQGVYVDEGQRVTKGTRMFQVMPLIYQAEVQKAAAEAGARWASFIPLRLPHGVKELFLDWLERRRPGRRAKVEHQLRELRGGRLNDPAFGSRMRGEGPYAEELRALFKVALRKSGLEPGGPRLSAAAFRRLAELVVEQVGGPAADEQPDWLNRVRGGLGR